MSITISLLPDATSRSLVCLSRSDMSVSSRNSHPPDAHMRRTVRIGSETFLLTVSPLYIVRVVMSLSAQAEDGDFLDGQTLEPEDLTPLQALYGPLRATQVTQQAVSQVSFFGSIYSIFPCFSPLLLSPSSRGTPSDCARSINLKCLFQRETK